MANPDKYTTGARKGKLKLGAIRKLVREHAKASKINIQNLDYKQTLTKLRRNGFIINHEEMTIRTKTRLTDGEAKSKRQFLLMDRPAPTPAPRRAPPPPPPPPPPRRAPPPPPPPPARRSAAPKKKPTGPPQLGDILAAAKGLRKTTTSKGRRTGVSEEEVRRGLKGLRKTPARKPKVVELTEFQKELKRRVEMKAKREKKKPTKKDVEEMIKTLKVKKTNNVTKKEAMDAAKVLREILKKK
jgi:hypothetical protein